MKKRKTAVRVARPPSPRPAKSTDELDAHHAEEWADAGREMQTAAQPKPAADAASFQTGAFTPPGGKR